MRINEIELKDFRNYKEIKVSFNDKVNIFIGENAQGKTNLLEGIYFNALSKSFKTGRDRDVIRFGEEFCRIKTSVNYDGDDHLIEIVINREGKKAIKTDGVAIRKSSELLNKVNIVVFSPEDMKIVKEDPSVRRNFIDREMCQIRPGYLMELGRYKRALKQRNTYLKEEYVEEDMLDVWDEEMVMSGSRLIRMRREFIEKVNEISGDIHGKISGGRENLELVYETDVDFPGEEEEKFREILRRERDKDKRYRVTGKGPHRDDIKISTDGRDMRKYGSQGQQRTAALSLKLSEIRILKEETGEEPVLLLDDVLSELDNERQKYLINSLGKSQIFITTTDLLENVEKSLPAGNIYRIKSGEIVEETHRG